jgi:hypothetical protein
LTVTAKMVVHPHATGPWLVTAGSRHFTVPPDLGRALQSCHRERPDLSELRACLAAQPAGAAVVAELLAVALASAKRPTTRDGPGLRLRRTLVAAEPAAAWAAFLAPLTSWSLMGLLAGGGVLGYAWPLWMGLEQPRRASGWALAAAVVLFLVTALWHELGHAAALRREGFPPGRIGTGLLFVLPVFFADVTAVGGLERAGRIRVDLAGVCFQIALGGGLFVLGHLEGVPAWAGSALVAAGSAAAVAVSWSLVPFVRSDGYWSLCDLLDRKDLHDPAPPGSSRTFRLGLRVLQVGNVLFTVAVGLMVLWRVGVLAAGLTSLLGAPEASQPVGWAAWGLGLSVTIAVWIRRRGLPGRASATS